MLLFLDSKVNGIRIRGSQSYNLGLVEIFDGNTGTWGSTCYSSWKYPAAQVACRQLGFANMRLSWGPWRQKHTKNVTITVGTINCTGNEPNLNQCHQSNELLNSPSECMPAVHEQAEVFCVGK